MSKNYSPYHAVFIIEAQSGLNLVSYHFGAQKYDDDLISGMFKALESFMNHLSCSKHYQEIRDINYGESRIIYERYGKMNPVIGVAITDLQNDSQRDHHLLQEIVESFYSQFESFLINFRGNIVPFLGFDRTICKMVEGQIKNRLRLEMPKNNPISSNVLAQLIKTSTEAEIPQKISSPRFPRFGFQSID